MLDDETWREIAGKIIEVLPQIDKMLSEANMPISKRSAVAFELVMEGKIEIEGDYEAFLLSDVHGRLRVIVSNWYRARYAAAVDTESACYETLIVIHGSPFLLLVPHTFSMPGEEKGTHWFAVPASVQDEEDPLDWISGGPTILQLSGTERSDLEAQTRKIGSSVRSIAYDLNSISSDAQSINRDLSASIIADLQTAARGLCGRDAGQLRNAGWNISQAVEKSLKLFIRRNGRTPKNTHDLESLAVRAEQCGLDTIDRALLSRIPSGSTATTMRYEGTYSLTDGLEAYFAAMEIMEPLAYAMREKKKYNVREARFLLKRPPWFEFDTEAFSAILQTSDVETTD